MRKSSAVLMEFSEKDNIQCCHFIGRISSPAYVERAFSKSAFFTKIPKTRLKTASMKTTAFELMPFKICHILSLNLYTEFKFPHLEDFEFKNSPFIFKLKYHTV